MTGFPFTKAQHLRAKADFERVYAKRVKAADGRILVFAARNDKPLTRIGLSVSKKHGCAVVRNRLKRLLREAFRLVQHDVPSGLDLILIPLSKDRANLAEFQEGISKISRKLARRLESDGSSNGEAAS